MSKGGHVGGQQEGYLELTFPNSSTMLQIFEQMPSGVYTATVEREDGLPYTVVKIELREGRL